MNKQTHISDRELRLAASEQPTQIPLEQIEVHVADCEECQSRLLELAADSEWRDELADGLKVVSSFTPVTMPVLLDPTRSMSDDEFDNPGRSGDEFDLQTVDRMLEEVLQSPTHPEMLGRLGRYEVESVIGCGGMGVVMRGFDRELHRPVAIKMILPRLSKNGTAKQRFLREARAAATVLHPNVIGIHDISQTTGVPWFVMPLNVGPSLKTLVEQNGPLAEREIVRIGLQIASGLAAAHSKGLVHRDIKPENILVDNQVNRVVITDFGLARCESEDAMTQTGMLAGTLNYMSPEQSRGDEIDGRSDLFSLGSLLYFLSTGVVPFRSSAAMGVIHKIGNEEHPNIQIENSEVSGILKETIDRLLAKSPAHRFQSAADLEVFLNDYLAHLHQPSQKAAPAIPKLARGRQADFRGPLKIFTALVTAALLGTTVWFATSMWGDTGDTGSKKSSRMWDEVRARYKLDHQNVFHSEMQKLGLEFSEAASWLNNHEKGIQFPFDWPTGSNRLLLEMQQLSSEIDGLSNGIGALPTGNGTPTEDGLNRGR